MPPPPPEGPIWSDGRPLGFRRLLAQAINDIAATGYVSPEQVAEWVTRLRNAAERELGSEEQIDADVARSLRAKFERFVDRGSVVERVPEVSRFNLTMIRPQLRAELDRRVFAATDLIKLNRREAVDRTASRLAGWITSIPPGGDATIDKLETRDAIGKSVAQFRYERRRVDIDQSHKLIANVTDIVARDAAAIAAVWHSHGEHDASYNARRDHLARAGKTYAIRNGWAYQQGLINKGAGLTDEMTAAAQEPFCQCWLQYIVSPRRLPDEMLTRKGQEWVARGAQRSAA